MSNRSASSEVKLLFNSTIQNALDSSAGGGAPATSSAPIQATLISGTLKDGINASQANRAWWSVGRSLGSGGNETLDLYQMIGLDIGAGSGNDALGQACLFEEIVCLIVICEAGSAGQLQIEGGTNNPLNVLSQTVANGGALKAGGVRLLFESDEQAIDLSSTKKNLKFSAIGGAVTYSVYVLGRHDDDESSSSSSLSSSSSSSSTSSSASSSSSSSSSSS